MNSIKYGDEALEYELKRKNKKNLSITVKPDATVTVSAPTKVSLEAIEKVLYKKLRWIWGKVEKARSNMVAVREKEYISGESFLYLGKNYKLKIIKHGDSKSISVKLHRGTLEITVPTDREVNQKDIKTVIEKWYREQAVKKIQERVKIYESKTKLTANLVRIKELKTSWGICTSRGNITYNWRIVMAPLSVLDYVVIHEICHLKHHNHSKDFWSLVGVYMTDYRTKKEWLKVNGKSLMV